MNAYFTVVVLAAAGHRSSWWNSEPTLLKAKGQNDIPAASWSLILSLCQGISVVCCHQALYPITYYVLNIINRITTYRVIVTISQHGKEHTTAAGLAFYRTSASHHHANTLVYTAVKHSYNFDIHTEYIPCHYVIHLRIPSV